MNWRLDYDEEEGRRSPFYHEYTNAPMFEYGHQPEESIPIVALYNIHGIEVASGIKQVVEPGDLLEGLALHPSKAAIFINKVEVLTEEVYELYSYTMGEYKDKVIC